MSTALKSSPSNCAAPATTSSVIATNRGTTELAPGPVDARLEWLFRRVGNDRQPHPLRPLIEFYRKTKAEKPHG